MNNWQDLFILESSKSYYQDLLAKVNEERKTKTIYPSKDNLFKAFDLTPYEAVKVVILGQDPYHEENQACGLAFSVPKGEKIPPSLRNIYTELHSDLNIDIPSHGDLSNWAKEGVLLLNAVLTVEKGYAQSHHNLGWQTFTDEVIRVLNLKTTPVVFILLGNDAKTKAHLITNPIHHIIMTSHPSPLSSYRGFFGSKIFSRTNHFLQEHQIKPIDWSRINQEH